MGKIRYFALQAGVAAIAVMMPTAASAQKRTFLVPAQRAGAGIATFAQQADAQILLIGEAGTQRTTNRVEGAFTVEEGIRLLLRGTGLVARQTAKGTFLVEVENGPGSAAASIDEEATAIPEILVEGQKGWSLNTGIKRTQNDSQPFIVLDQQAIKRSGAPNLETFLRDQLSVNAASTTAEQSGNANAGRSVVNLRGLGERETLILVDGRRMPGINTGDGLINQADISAIPLDSIERIEVLASSASGIYGSGATGGVINIILRRDYTGLSVTATRGGTFAGGRDETRFDLTGGMSLEDGATNVTLSASWRDTAPLLVSDRPEFLTEGRRRALANNPDAYAFNPPLGATPNLRGASGAPLTLDPEYGGATLPSNYASVPAGYRGPAVDGVAPLIANAGRYALDLADTAQLTGGRAPLLYATRQASGSLAVRRDFTGWLKLYAEAAASRSTTLTPGSLAPATIRLAADAPNNPFTDDLILSVPQIGADYTGRSRIDQLRLLAGGIVQLGGGWQGVVDVQQSRTTNTTSRDPAPVDGATAAAMADGSIDIVRDLRLSPIDYRYVDSIYGTYRTPASSRLFTVSARVAGPLPVTLPGGRPQMTVNLERSLERSSRTITVNNGDAFSRIAFTPERSQRIESVYAEISLPVIGDNNKIPFVRLLEVKLSARHERYKGTGADADIECYFNSGRLESDGLFDQCPTPGLVVPTPSTRNQHSDPTISMRWQPVRDVTFRGSYATGYLPPNLNQLVKVAGPVFGDARDPARGGEAIGQPTGDGVTNFLDGFTGGNPDVEPESSKTLTAGIILQPRFVPGLRLSADWTRITKRNNYFDPSDFLFTDGTAEGQAAFENFLKLYPDRIVRGPASDGFPVGPIISIDLSTANLSGSTSEAVDFVADYTHGLFGGTLDVAGRATWVRDLSIRQFPEAPVVDYTGVSDNNFQFGSLDIGSVRWKGVGSLNWSNDRFGIGWQTRFTDGYYVSITRMVQPSLGSARVPGQIYHDLSVRYLFPHRLTLRAGINNVFDTAPPFDTSVLSQIYSKYGDPRRANFFLTINKAF